MHRLRSLSLGGRLLLALAVGGAVFGIASAVQASIPDANGVIHGCYNPNGAKATNGTALNIIDTSSAGCTKNMQAVSWSQIGPTGSKGTTGAKGPTGARGPTGQTGAVGPSNAYTNYGEVHSIGAELTQTVSSVTLPIGSYTLSAAVRVFAPEDGDATFVECKFVSAGALHSNLMQTTTQGFDLDNVTETAMPLIGDVTITTDNTAVFLRCTSINPSTADVQASMIATQVGTITPSE